jgi:Ser/Thr protein kinase RdoA (MazF antagonist)
VLFEERYSHLLPPARRDVYQRAIDRVGEALEALYTREGHPRVLHNDLHHWNVKIYRGKAYALDFEDLMWGHPVQDIAVALYYYFGYENYAALRDAFQRGYTSICPWPEVAPGEIDTFIAGRGLTLANYVLEDADPDWRAMAPEFVERVEGRLRRLLNL